MLFALCLSATLAASAAPTMGTISFPVTGNKACQREFTDGMLALHSFMYRDARDHFQAAAKADPACAMARWGEAMTYNHPLWGEEEPKESRAALAAITGEDKLTPKEKAFIAAARALSGDGEYRARMAGWLDATEKMWRDFPKDDEVALQHALALIANSQRLAKTRLLAQSTAISMEVAQRNPKHPGALHYWIHACDTPELAILGLPAARAYAKVAPDASHALHMPSHIFTQLGMHSDVVASNIVSWAAAQKERERRKLPTDDGDWHSYSWLAVTYGELGQLKKARELQQNLADTLTREDGPKMRGNYGLITRALTMNGGRWDELEAALAPISRPMPLEPGEAEGGMGCGLHAPGGSGMTRPPFGVLAFGLAIELRAEAAMRRGDEKALTEVLAARKKVNDALSAWKGVLSPDGADRIARFDAAMIAGARAKAKGTPKAWEEAIAAFQKLADLREQLVGGPAFETPYQTLLGDALLDAGKPKDATAAYEKALERYPGQARTLLSAARAAKASGDPAAARKRYATLAAQWKDADAELPELDEVRAGAVEGAQAQRSP